MLIHPDVNAVSRNYKHLAANEALVTKIFFTIQGEGPFAGEPCVFVRLAGCNLGAKDSCPWCDTYFALKAGTVMRVADILTEAEQLIKMRSLRSKLMVLTGGEPMLQNPHVLVEYFLNHDWRVQIETNGYFWSREMHELSMRRLWNEDVEHLTVVVSPKVNARKVYPEIDTLLWQDSSCLKILVDDDPQSAYYSPPPYAERYAQSGRPVYVGPITHYLREPAPGEIVSIWDMAAPTVHHARCRRNHSYAAAIVKRTGWRLSLQTHLYAEQE